MWEGAPTPHNSPLSTFPRGNQKSQLCSLGLYWVVLTAGWVLRASSWLSVRVFSGLCVEESLLEELRTACSARDLT